MNSARRTASLPAVGFPIRTSPDQSLVSGSPTLFAATHVLLRLLSPRHPSCALCSLVISLHCHFTFSRRPGSSAAPWLTEARRTTHTCLLAHMQLSKSGPELPGLSKSDSKPTGDCEHRFDLVAARAVAGGEAP